MNLRLDTRLLIEFKSSVTLGHRAVEQESWEHCAVHCGLCHFSIGDRALAIGLLAVGEACAQSLVGLRVGSMKDDGWLIREGTSQLSQCQHMLECFEEEQACISGLEQPVQSAYSTSLSGPIFSQMGIRRILSTDNHKRKSLPSAMYFQAWSMMRRRTLVGT